MDRIQNVAKPNQRQADFKEVKKFHTEGKWPVRLFRNPDDMFNEHVYA